MSSTSYDLAVIGGGINGAGIARDAAGRGARVLLLEKGDLAQGTSSASTKLIHGGLRYLEHYEFGLVREALREREVLWGIAPHLIAPLRLVLPHVAGLRPRWLVRLGLFLYDHMGGRKLLPATEGVTLSRHPAGMPLKSEFTHGFAFSDCRADDARLVVLNARDAADRGAEVLTRCEVTRLERGADAWRIVTTRGEFNARAVVNASGPAVLDTLERAHAAPDYAMRLVRGSHIVVKKLFDHSFAYFFQLPDGRIFFAIPYEEDFTLIGTTDRDHTGGLDTIEPSEEEIAYLCEGASRFFRKPVLPADVVWAWAGVRPLVDDKSGKPEGASRGYRLDLSEPEEGATLLSVYGGKLTTYRHLAEAAIALLAERLPMLNGPSWTGSNALPGGDFPVDGLPALTDALTAAYPFLDPFTARRLARAYGTRVMAMLGDTRQLADCGRHFGSGLTERELEWLFEREWARCADDALWRRSKLGLRLSLDECNAVGDWFENR